jgi:hypothetical protein
VYRARQFEFDGEMLYAAIIKTFTARKLQVGAIEIPDIFSKNFSDQTKESQWNSFLQQNKLNTITESFPFKTIINSLSSFILPIITAIKSNQIFPKKWNKLYWV